jgi:hypothetical protein
MGRDIVILRGYVRASCRRLALSLTTTKDYKLKICAECKIEQTLDNFASNKSKPDGKSDKCRTCKKAYNVEYYKRTKHIHNPSRHVRREFMREQAKTYVRKLKSAPCTDCNNTYHFMAMDFDHVQDNKVRDIADMVRHGATIKTLAEEISKCELVCAVCHRLRTAYRLGMITLEETNMRR